MKFKETKIENVVICESEIFSDSRGHFFESFRSDLLEEFLGFKIHFCQINQSISKKNVIRGLHFQKEPLSQSKLVAVPKGRILDVVVDIRSDSKTFGKHLSVEISDKKKNSIFVPKGCAHGFISLEEDTIVSYLVDNFYSSKLDSGIRFNDSDLKIDWGIDLDLAKISPKDSNLPNFKDYLKEDI